MAERFFFDDDLAELFEAAFFLTEWRFFEDFPVLLDLLFDLLFDWLFDLLPDFFFDDFPDFDCWVDAGALAIEAPVSSGAATHSKPMSKNVIILSTGVKVKQID